MQSRKLIVLIIISLLLSGCGKKKFSPESMKAGEQGISTNAIPADAFDRLLTEPGEDAPDKSTGDELVDALQEGYDILVDARDTLYSYYSDRTVSNNEEITRGIVLADELLAKIDKLDRSKLKPSLVAKVYDEMSNVMDIFSRISPSEDPRSIDILQMREELKGSMWIDDEINTYIFDKDGETMYLALAGEDEPSGGTYSVSFTDEAIRFTFSIPELTTEVKGDVTEFSKNAFRFTDVNTGDEFYLTPVDR